MTVGPEGDEPAPHDLGGADGFGPVPARQASRSFQHDWEARAFALDFLVGALGRWSVDAARHAVERLPPADYRAMSYYERWLAALAAMSIKAGLVGRAELISGRAGAHSTLRPVQSAEVAALAAAGDPSARAGTAPGRFFVGDAVRANRRADVGHTRLPRYLAGRIGRVVADRGAHVLPDIRAAGGGAVGERLYSVRFAAADLWAKTGACDTGDHVVAADLWESYLDPVAVSEG